MSPPVHTNSATLRRAVVNRLAGWPIGWLGLDGAATSGVFFGSNAHYCQHVCRSIGLHCSLHGFGCWLTDDDLRWPVNTATLPDKRATIRSFVSHWPVRRTMLNTLFTRDTVSVVHSMNQNYCYSFVSVWFANQFVAPPIAYDFCILYEKVPTNHRPSTRFSSLLSAQYITVVISTYQKKLSPFIFNAVCIDISVGDDG